MIHGRYRLSRPALFGMLMCLAAVALLLPPRWTDALKHVVQLMVPAQDLAYTAAHAATRSVSSLDPAQQASPDADRNKLLQAVASQAALIDQLEAQNRRLSALRRDHLDVNVPLLAAHVVSQDIATWRDSVLVARGSTGGVAYRDWVTARLFVDRGFASDVESNQPVLASQGLIGRVEQVSPYLSRVQLLTDIDAPRVEVRVAHVRDGAAHMLDYSLSIKGAGRGTMAIESIDYRWIESPTSENPKTSESSDSTNRIAIGDFVYTAPGQLGLPRPVVIGRITSLSENARTRRVFDAVIEPVARVENIREIYIVPLTPTASFRVPQ